MTYTPRNMLVTGGAGFIGSHFVHRELAADESLRIVCLDLLTYAGDRRHLDGLPEPERFTFLHGDIRDPNTVRRAFEDHEIDTVVHFAAATHVDRSIDGPDVFVTTNVNGTFTLLDAARHAWLVDRGWTSTDCRFHHISTDEVFGTLGEEDPPFHEASLYRPNSPYSASKAGADHLVRAYVETYGLPVTASNCSNNYGPRQNVEKLLPVVIAACRTGRRIPVYGDGSNRRDWLHVHDHCDAIGAIIRRGRLGESYNVGGGAERSNLEVVERVCARFDELHPGRAPHSSLIEFVVDRPGHDWRYAIDSGKIRRELGWTPTRSLEEGIAATVDAYLADEDWCDAVDRGAGTDRRGIERRDGAEPHRGGTGS